MSLNGLGLREKFFFDIYVGGLYLKNKTGDACKAIESDEPKAVVMNFIYSSLTKEQIVEAFDESFAKNPKAAPLKKISILLFPGFPLPKKGDKFEFDYLPGTGTTFKVNGQSKGTIAGVEFGWFGEFGLVPILLPKL